MKQLLIRADDIGYSYAVNVGIARTVHEGLVRSVGVMPNMPEARHRSAHKRLPRHTVLGPCEHTLPGKRERAA